MGAVVADPTGARMGYLVGTLVLLVAVTVYVGVRQHRHPVQPGKPRLKHGDGDPDSRSWDGPPTGSGF